MITGVKRARGILMSLLMLWSIVAAAQQTPAWLVKDAPARYVVKPGDTLWEIACRYLHDPWRWQEIWEENPGLENPNLIYPGDQLVLIFEEGRPIIRREPGLGPRTQGIHADRMASSNVRWKTVRSDGVIVLRPHTRVLPPEPAIPTIPLEVIGPFLNESRVITQHQAEHCPLIVALDEDHILVGKGDRIFVEGLGDSTVGAQYDVVRRGKTYVDPRTNAILGIEGLVLGKTRLEVPGRMARLMLRHSFAEIKVGDRIMGTGTERVDPYFVPKLPRNAAWGQILSVFNGVNQIGQYQLLVISGGKDKQREIGDVLSILQTHKDLPSTLHISNEHAPFPPLAVGRCIVFRVYDKVSFVLVMNAIRPIYLLDAVTRP